MTPDQRAKRESSVAHGANGTSAGPDADDRRPGAPRTPRHYAPASKEQRDLWLHALTAPAVPLYNEAFTIRRLGSLDPALVERSFATIIDRHGIWRTSFDGTGGTLRQVVHPRLRIGIPFDDLSGLPEGDRERAAAALATADARRPFDLARLPLLRVRVVRLGPDDHRIYLALHHLIFDGVSITRVIVPELIAVYAAYAGGREPPAASPALQYADYAARQDQAAKSGRAHGDLDYWRRQLAPPLPVLELPSDRPRPPQPSYAGAMEVFELPAPLSGRLKALGRSSGATLYTVLLTAFKTLVYRYTGREDLVIGGVTDTRNRSELADMVGYFLNGVALRTRPAAALTFRQYLAQVQDVVVDALDASGTPLGDVIQAIGGKRSGGSHPIYQVLFSIQPPPARLEPGWDVTQMDVDIGVAKFDLYVEMEERADRLVGRFIYSRDLFEAARIRAMIGHWRVLLHGIAADPDERLSRLPILGEAECAAIRAQFAPAAAAMVPQPLPFCFEQQAAATPDAIAIECDGQSWRYRDLDARQRSIAAALREAGVGPRHLVAVLLERSCDMVAALLGVMRTGGAYLPLDPQLPPARLAFLIEDARPAVILTQASLAGGIAPAGSALVIIDNIPPQDRFTPSEERPSCRGDDLAYVLYTSGSTGKPKAVEIEHAALANLLTAMRDEWQFEASDALLAVTTISFDIAALELFLPLLAGGRLVVASRAEASDPVRLMARLRGSRCTVMQATPATWRALVVAGWRGDPQLTIVCGGEALQPDLARQLLRRGACLWNAYGPTETTIWSLLHRVQESDDPVPIGRAIANTGLVVVDTNDQLVAPGVAGELLIAGTGLARGYRNDPALTRQKFATIAALPGQRLYRTGDLVRQRPDGLLEFLGRVDNQVKIRGFRVGLEEVEAAIASHPAVAAAAVRAVRDASAESSLAAYVVMKPPGTEGFDAVRQHVARLLPGYMVPQRWTALPALPLNANGKVDRARLPAPASPPPPASERPQSGSLEALLAEIWCRLLARPRIGLHDDFFELGGHSLLAAMMAAEFKNTTGRELPLAVLFRASTIAALADVLRSQEEPAFSHLVGLRPRGSGRPLYIVHGIFGNVLQLRGLAERIVADRPIYALQARGADPRLEPHASIGEMATAYLEAIREFQPSGPYALAGYSFGGLIAFEMACRLREAGEEVDVLALLATEVHERNLPFGAMLSYKAVLARRVAKKLLSSGIRTWPAYLLAKVRLAGHRFLLRHGLAEPGDPWLESPELLTDRTRRMYKTYVREFVAYRPRAYQGAISVFCPRGPSYDSCDPLPIWRKVADHVAVFSIPGTHQTIMDEPHVNSLARQLDRCLAGNGGDAARHAGVGRGNKRGGEPSPATVVARNTPPDLPDLTAPAA